MISDEAIQAAMDAGGKAEWFTRKILEAAAPHMTDRAAETRLLAIAWTEAYGAGFQEGAGFGQTPNPYRPTK